MKRLFLDLETCPNIGSFWSAGYKINLSPDNIEVERRIITAAYKWEGKKKIHALIWEEGKKQFDQSDAKLIKCLAGVLNDADEIVAHYGDGFDVPWVRTRAMFHGIVVPKWKSVDTKAWASKYFYLNSNKLDYIAKFLGIGTKIRTEYDLWRAITFRDDPEALAKMVRYNKHDVFLLEKVYNRLKLYCPVHSHEGVMQGNDRWSCPGCGSEHVGRQRPLVSRAGIVSHQMHCHDCGRYYNVSNHIHEQFKSHVSSR